MKDQASGLREKMQFVGNHPENGDIPGSRVIAVASGKGGVGKSNFCVNFALALSNSGYRPIVIDTDVGFANVEVLLGTSPAHTILDVLNGMNIWEVIQHSPWGLSFLSAGQGLTDIHSLTNDDVELLVAALAKLQDRYDVILLDSGAGMGSHAGRLVVAADELIMVTTPEPTSITDAYAFLKMLASRGVLPKTHLIVNRAHDIADARATGVKLQMVTERFLQLQTDILGYILEDDAVVRSVMRQQPLYYTFPNSRASRCFNQVVKNFSSSKSNPAENNQGLRGFFSRLLRRNSPSGGESNSSYSG
jgi:flagellar biosynthesis protein FlhG